MKPVSGRLASHPVCAPDKDEDVRSRASPREVQRFLEMVRNDPISNFAC